MKATFTVKDKQYELSLDKRERVEDDKFNPFGATVSGHGGGVQGVFQITDEALKVADERAQADAGVSAGDLLAKACGKSAATELVIRRLKPDFSFVVDHRFVENVS